MTETLAPTLPTISPHVRKAANRLHEKRWGDRCGYRSLSLATVELPTPSEEDKGTTYRVVVDLRTGKGSCNCKAGSHDRLCKHLVFHLDRLGFTNKFPWVGQPIVYDPGSDFEARWAHVLKNE